MNNMVLNASAAIIIYYNTVTEVYFPLPADAENYEFKLSIRETLDWNTPSMCDANGIIADNQVTFELNSCTEEFAEVCRRSGSAYLEIYVDTESEKQVFLQRKISISSRAGSLHGQPPTPVKLYYTREEVDNLLAKGTFYSAGEGIVISGGTVSVADNVLKTVDGNLKLAGGITQVVTVIPPDTASFELGDLGKYTHVPVAASTYTLPAVTDNSTSHEIELTVSLANTASVAFSNADFADIPDLVQGESWIFLAKYVIDKWVIFPIKAVANE